MRQKKIALINDLSGFGRCSLTVSLPIISVLKVECAVLPTCVLSTHTAYPSYYMKDLTDDMDPWMDEWKDLDLSFDGIYTGFLGSEEQIDKVLRFMDLFPSKKIIVDPVMGDHGKIYATYTPEMCQSMKKLVHKASLITPNLTEACILLDREYREDFTDRELLDMAEDLRRMGPEQVVISGIEEGEFIKDIVVEPGRRPAILKNEKVAATRHGTGDVFASIVAAETVKGRDLLPSVAKASGFVRSCLEVSEKFHVDNREGVAFEEILNELIEDEM